jgi:hypothetical protein
MTFSFHDPRTGEFLGSITLLPGSRGWPFIFRPRPANYPEATT